MGEIRRMEASVPLTIYPQVSLGTLVTDLKDRMRTEGAVHNTRGAHFVMDEYLVVNHQLRPESQYPPTMRLDVSVRSEDVTLSPRVQDLSKVHLEATHRWIAAHGYEEGVWKPVYSSLLPSQEFPLVAANASGYEQVSSQPEYLTDEEFRFYNPAYNEFQRSHCLKFTSDDMLRTITGGWVTNSGMGVMAVFIPEVTDPKKYTHLLGFIPPTRREGDLFGVSLLLRGSAECALVLDNPGPGGLVTLDAWRHLSSFTAPWVVGLSVDVAAQTMKTLLVTEGVMREKTVVVPKANVNPLRDYLFSLDLALFASDAEEGMNLFDVCMWHEPPPAHEWDTARAMYCSAFGAGSRAL